MALWGRGRREQSPRTLTAAGKSLDTATPDEIKRARTGAAWQQLAWSYYDAVGEVWYATEFQATSAARMRLFPGVITEPDQPPVPIADSDLREFEPIAWAEIDRLSDAQGSTGPLMYGAVVNLSIPGEGYLLGRLIDPNDPTSEEWSFRSIDELRRTDKGWVLREHPSPAGTVAGNDEGTLLEGPVWVERVWKPHPRFSALADSPMRRLLDVCEELLLLSRVQRVTDRSRIANAGLLLVAQEAESVADDDADHGFRFDSFYDSLVASMQAAIRDENSASSIVPISVQVPMETIDKGFRLMSFNRERDQQIAERQVRALGRLGQGLNVPPEVITGMAQANHWSAWQIDESTFTHHVEPSVLLVTGALTTVYLRPWLLRDGVPAEAVDRMVVSYDPADLVTRPNAAKDALDASDRGAVGRESVRKHLGFGPADVPTQTDELIYVAKSLRGVDPALQSYILRRIDPNAPEVTDPGSSSGGETPPPPDDGSGAPPSPTQDATPPAASWQRRARLAARRARLTLVASGAPDPQLERLSKRQVRLDSQLRARLQGACDVAINRTLERAGAKIRASARRDPVLLSNLRTIPNRNVSQFVGHRGVVHLGLDTGDLTDETFGGLDAEWDQWISGAQADATALAGQIAGGRISDAQVAALATRQVSDRAAGWTVLRAGLLAIASERLYGTTVVETRGEGDDSVTVPMGLVRRALATAGGTTRVSAGISETGGPLQDGDAIGQIATGGAISDLLVDAGVESTGYEWVYGVSRRPFPPHEQLDGATFDTFTDDTLANSEGWPGPFCTPGDHDGCNCDYRVLYAGDQPQGAQAAEANTRGDQITEAAHRVRNSDDYDALQRAINDPNEPVPGFE